MSAGLPYGARPSKLGVNRSACATVGRRSAPWRQSSQFTIVQDFPHGAQDFADRPSLCDGAMGRKRSLTLKNFAQSPKTIHVYRNSQRFEKTHGFGTVAVHAQVRQHKGSQKPAPDRALVVSRVAILRTAHVMSLVPGFAGSNAAQPVRGQKM